MKLWHRFKSTLTLKVKVNNRSNMPWTKSVSRGVAHSLYIIWWDTNKIKGAASVAIQVRNGKLVSACKSCGKFLDKLGIIDGVAAQDY